MSKTGATSLYLTIIQSQANRLVWALGDTVIDQEKMANKCDSESCVEFGEV